MNPLRVKRDGGHSRPWDFVEHIDQEPPRWVPSLLNQSSSSVETPQPRLMTLSGQQRMRVQKSERAVPSRDGRVAYPLSNKDMVFA